MKITKTFYYQFQTATPALNSIPNTTPPPADFPLPSGEYDYASLVALVAEIDTTARIPINIPFKVIYKNNFNLRYCRWILGFSRWYGNSILKCYTYNLICITRLL